MPNAFRKPRPSKLKCRTGRFQCGSSCQPIVYKSTAKGTEGKWKYTNCGKNAEGMPKTGLEFLQRRVDAVNEKRAARGNRAPLQFHPDPEKGKLSYPERQGKQATPAPVEVIPLDPKIQAQIKNLPAVGDIVEGSFGDPARVIGHYFERRDPLLPPAKMKVDISDGTFHEEAESTWKPIPSDVTIFPKLYPLTEQEVAKARQKQAPTTPAKTAPVEETRTVDPNGKKLAQKQSEPAPEERETEFDGLKIKDVFALLDKTPPAQRRALAKRIGKARPDLASEVDESMEDLKGETNHPFLDKEMMGKRLSSMTPTEYAKTNVIRVARDIAARHRNQATLNVKPGEKGLPFWNGLAQEFESVRTVEDFDAVAQRSPMMRLDLLNYDSKRWWNGVYGDAIRAAKEDGQPIPPGRIKQFEGISIENYQNLDIPQSPKPSAVQTQAPGKAANSKKAPKPKTEYEALSPERRSAVKKGDLVFFNPQKNSATPRGAEVIGIDAKGMAQLEYQTLDGKRKIAVRPLSALLAPKPAGGQTGAQPGSQTGAQPGGKPGADQSPKTVPVEETRTVDPNGKKLAQKQSEPAPEKQHIDMDKDEALAKRTAAESTRDGKKFIKQMDAFLLKKDLHTAQLVDYNPKKKTVTILNNGAEITYAGGQYGDFYEIARTQSTRKNPFQSSAPEKPARGKDLLRQNLAKFEDEDARHIASYLSRAILEGRGLNSLESYKVSNTFESMNEEQLTELVGAVNGLIRSGKDKDRFNYSAQGMNDAAVAIISGKEIPSAAKTPTKPSAAPTKQESPAPENTPKEYGTTLSGQGVLFPVSPLLNKDRHKAIARARIPQVREAIAKTKAEINENTGYAPFLASLQSRLARMQQQLRQLKEIEAGNAYFPRTAKTIESGAAGPIFGPPKSRLTTAQRQERIESAEKSKEQRQYDRETARYARQDKEEQDRLRAEESIVNDGYSYIQARQNLRSLRKNGAPAPSPKPAPEMGKGYGKNKDLLEYRATIGGDEQYVDAWVQAGKPTSEKLAQSGFDMLNSIRWNGIKNSPIQSTAGLILSRESTMGLPERELIQSMTGMQLIGFVEKVAEEHSKTRDYFVTINEIIADVASKTPKPAPKPAPESIGKSDSKPAPAQDNEKPAPVGIQKGFVESSAAKPGRDKLTKATVTIPSAQRGGFSPITLKGRMAGDFLAGKGTGYEGNKWQVTHIPSGLSIYAEDIIKSLDTPLSPDSKKEKQMAVELATRTLASMSIPDGLFPSDAYEASAFKRDQVKRLQEYFKTELAAKLNSAAKAQSFSERRQDRPAPTQGQSMYRRRLDPRIERMKRRLAQFRASQG